MEMRWIPCTERMPEEHDSIFAKVYGTERWRNGMFRKRSDKVLATVKFEDGSIMTDTASTFDGEWRIGTQYISRNGDVIAWMPLPEPYTAGTEEPESPVWFWNGYMRI